MTFISASPAGLPTDSCFGPHGLIGAGEVLLRSLILGFWNVRAAFAANICLMLLAAVAVTVNVAS